MNLSQAKAIAEYGMSRRPPETGAQFYTKNKAENLRAFSEQMVGDFGRSRTYWLARLQGCTSDTGDVQ